MAWSGSRYACTEIDEAQLAKGPVREQIVLFDDVLTSGKHYKIAKTRIRERLPDQKIIAVFVARVIHFDPAAEFEVID